MLDPGPLARPPKIPALSKRLQAIGKKKKKDNISKGFSEAGHIFIPKPNKENIGKKLKINLALCE